MEATLKDLIAAGRLVQVLRDHLGWFPLYDGRVLVVRAGRSLFVLRSISLAFGAAQKRSRAS
jgi:hypothetical protein